MVEGDGNVFWPQAFNQIAEEAREAEYRVHGIARTVAHVRQYRVVRPKT